MASRTLLTMQATSEHIDIDAESQLAFEQSHTVMGES